MSRSYRRHLPHEIPAGFPIFVTWSLKGVLPAEVLARLKRAGDVLRAGPARANESPWDCRIREAKIIFAQTDQLWDAATSGPLHLKGEQEAKIVEDSILFGVGGRYALYSWCVMANHVHVLLKPAINWSKIIQGIKGFTANAINQLHDTRGRIFWQQECYDHWPRDEAEMLRIIQYIENNPVAAGLCKLPKEWPWSSARFRANWSPGQAYQANENDRRTLE